MGKNIPHVSSTSISERVTGHGDVDRQLGCDSVLGHDLAGPHSVCLRSRLHSITERLHHRRTKGGRSLEPETVASIQKMFGTMLQAMLTLYMATSGGIDWVEVYDIVGFAGWLLQLLFVFFLGFFGFAILNIVMGIFLEKAMRSAEFDRETIALEKRKKDRADADALRELLASLDWEHDGFLSMKEFKSHLEDERVRGYLAALGLDVGDAEMFYEVLMDISGGCDEGDEEETILIDDFVEHCTRMKGHASSIDVAALSFEVKIVRRDLQELIDLTFAKYDTSSVSKNASLPIRNQSSHDARHVIPGSLSQDGRWAHKK